MNILPSFNGKADFTDKGLIKKGTLDFRAPPGPGTTVYNPYGRNKLCCNQSFSSDVPYRYKVTVYGRTPDVMFDYESANYSVNPVIPVIGLYAAAPTSVFFELTDESGNAFQFSAIYDRRDLYDDFTGHVLQIAFNVDSTAMAESTIYNGWFFNGYYVDAYDKNGDIRVCGFCDIKEPNMPMKIHNDLFYVPDEELGGIYYTARYLKLTIMGQTMGTHEVPLNFGFHHDLTWDDEGFVYFLISKLTDGNVNSLLESTIIKVNDETGAIVAVNDFSSIYGDFDTIVYSGPYDAHFNSLTYVGSLDQLIVNSRNSSSYFGVDKNTLQPLWTVQDPDPGQKQLFPSRNLSVVNPGEFVFINGAHTVFETLNPAYDAYRGPGKAVLSIFDNAACKDENGKGIYIPTSQGESQDLGFAWDSAVQIVAVDLNNNTVEQLARFTLPGQRSIITSSVFDSDDRDYFQVYYGVPTDFFVIDTNGVPGLSARKMRPDLDFPVEYRGRVFSMSAIIAALKI